MKAQLSLDMTTKRSNGDRRPSATKPIVAEKRTFHVIHPTA